MTILQSNQQSASAEFAQNTEAMEAQYKAVAEEAARIVKGGSEASRQRHEGVSGLHLVPGGARRRGVPRPAFDAGDLLR